MSRANQWFVTGDGIAREVITADIQRYLGPDALVRPGVGTGEYQGQAGYWITAYRTLTSPMIQDLKMDSQRWQQERQPGDAAGRGVAYQDSRTHAARQHWGPTKPYEHATEASSYDAAPRGSTSSRATYAASSTSGYAPSEGSHYTTSSSMSPYGSSHPGYQPSPAAATPRNPPADPYSSSYQQPPSREYSQQPAYGSYTAQTTADPYSRQAVPSTSYATSSSQYATSGGQYATPSAPAAAPGFYIASDGRQYPLSQQPQPSRGSRR